MTFPHPSDEKYDDIGLESVCLHCGGRLKHLPWCKALEEDEVLPVDPGDAEEDDEDYELPAG